MMNDKVLNIIIAVLVIVIMVSGGVFLYSVFSTTSNSTTDSANPSQANTAAVNTPSPIENINDNSGSLLELCVDNDKDGYGENCEKGDDCDDTDFSRNITCRSLENALILRELSSIDPETVLVEVVVGSTLNSELDGLELVLNIDDSKLLLSSYDIGGEDRLAINVNEDNDGIVGLHVTGSEKFSAGETLLTLEFEVVGSGSTEIQPDPSLRLTDSTEKVRYSTNVQALSLNLI